MGQSIPMQIKLATDISLKDEEATLAYGAALSAHLDVGDVVCLTGDLGAGKTTLSRGLISALLGPTEVPSPTYTLVQTYNAPNFQIWHFDLYRMERPEHVWELGIEEALESGVSLIEWPERLEGLKPEGTLDIDIRFTDGGRVIRLEGDEEWSARFG